MRQGNIIEELDDCNSNDGSHLSNFDNSMDGYPINDNTLVQKIVRRETRFVRGLRLGLLFILLSASAVASALVYQTLTRQENQDFEDAFHDYSTKLTNEFQGVAERRLGAIAAFSTSITSNALKSQNDTTSSSDNNKWPFVIIPQYEAQARYVAKIAHLQTLGFAPIVTAEQRNQWEQEFVPQHVNEWISESIASKFIYDESTNQSFASYKIVKAVRNQTHIMVPGYRERIFETIVLPDGNLTYNTSDESGPYMPLWQISPFVPGDDHRYINFDMNTDVTFDRNLIRILRQQKAALGRMTTLGYGRYAGNPTSGFYYPVLTDLPQNSTLAGSLVTLIFWLPFFSNILPESAVGIVGVLENTCNQTFTFRIDGANVTFISNDDRHDPNYDYLSQEVSFLSLITESYEKEQYLGFPIDDTGCKYSLSIYPSNDLQNEHVTNTPMIAAILILVIFLMTSLVFILYDRLLERRQRLVQKEAESSGAIISSLFPAAYRDRLMAAQTTTENSSCTNVNAATNALAPHACRNFLKEEGRTKGQPIADLYPECTVFFADIAGFTHWSSTREPVQVFCLLQELYGAIDKIAKKYHIFKVETIGDCYMAVTGLPNPQRNHVQLMARFSTECIVQIRETTIALMDTLGDDTAELKLRIGLHSGPVTAGILRGEKSRFQLFGDTVNTASRMESTGEPDRVQVSSVTAEIIKKNGKGHWLLPRPDLVEVKGKGTFQTYWLVNVSGQSTIRRSVASYGIADDENDIGTMNEGTDNWHEDSYNLQKSPATKTRRRQSVGELIEW